MQRKLRRKKVPGDEQERDHAGPPVPSAGGAGRPGRLSQRLTPPASRRTRYVFRWKTATARNTRIPMGTAPRPPQRRRRATWAVVTKRKPATAAPHPVEHGFEGGGHAPVEVEDGDQQDRDRPGGQHGDGPEEGAPPAPEAAADEDGQVGDGRSRAGAG